MPDIVAPLVLAVAAVALTLFVALDELGRITPKEGGE